MEPPCGWSGSAVLGPGSGQLRPSGRACVERRAQSAVAGGSAPLAFSGDVTLLRALRQCCESSSSQLSLRGSVLRILLFRFRIHVELIFVTVIKFFISFLHIDVKVAH